MSTQTTIHVHPGHAITVTPGPFGRAFFDCTCGEAQVRASKSSGVRAALAHHHDAGGCNCPNSVIALPEHGTVRIGTGGGSDLMKAGARVTIPGHILAGRGPRGERMFQPGLPGRWVIWSQVDSGPGHHAVTPADDDARATGITWATVRIQFPKGAAHPDVQLIACEPHGRMPRPFKHEENGAHR